MRAFWAIIPVALIGAGHVLFPLLKGAGRHADSVVSRPPMEVLEAAGHSGDSLAKPSGKAQDMIVGSKSVDATGSALGQERTLPSRVALSNQEDVRHRQFKAVLSIAKERGNTPQSLAAKAKISKLDTSVLSQRMASYAAVPESKEQFEKVFGAPPSGIDLSNVTDVGQKFRTEIAADEIPNNFPDLLASLKRRSELIVTFTGHNQTGAMLLKDGSQLDLRTMSLICAEARKICIFFSCSSKRYVLNDAIGMPLTLTFEDAHQLLITLSEFHKFAVVNSATPDDFINALPILLALENYKLRVPPIIKYVAILGVVPTGLIAVGAIKKKTELDDQSATQILEATASADKD